MRHEVASEQGTAAWAKTAGCGRSKCQELGVAVQLRWSPSVRRVPAPWHGMGWEAAVEGTAPWTQPAQLVAGHSPVSCDPCSAMGWSLPVQKELSLEGWAENPASCMVPQAAKPLWNFCVFATQRKSRLRLISVKFCRFILSEPLTGTTERVKDYQIPANKNNLLSVLRGTFMLVIKMYCITGKPEQMSMNVAFIFLHHQTFFICSTDPAMISWFGIFKSSLDDFLKEAFFLQTHQIQCRDS